MITLLLLLLNLWNFRKLYFRNLTHFTTFAKEANSINENARDIQYTNTCINKKDNSEIKNGDIQNEYKKLNQKVESSNNTQYINKELETNLYIKKNLHFEIITMKKEIINKETNKNNIMKNKKNMINYMSIINSGKFKVIIILVFN